ncbi:hypothetical protein MUG91_G51n7 [Manis pentadactyla]|nr:hypothetical protein MUG91_G51n7 [Manis pentadactyla]
MGDLSENSMENFQEKRLRDLLHEEVSCWLILEDMASTVTEGQDCIVDLQGEVCRKPELNLSPCQQWREASSHIPRNKTSVVSLPSDDFKNIKSEEYLSLKVPSQMATQDSSVTFCKNKPQDPQESKNLLLTEESTRKKVIGGKSPPMNHCSENLQIELVADVTEMASPLSSGARRDQRGAGCEERERGDAEPGAVWRVYPECLPAFVSYPEDNSLPTRSVSSCRRPCALSHKNCLSFFDDCPAKCPQCWALREVKALWSSSVACPGPALLKMCRISSLTAQFMMGPQVFTSSTLERAGRVVRRLLNLNLKMM